MLRTCVFANIQKMQITQALVTPFFFLAFCFHAWHFSFFLSPCTFPSLSTFSCTPSPQRNESKRASQQEGYSSQPATHRRSLAEIASLYASRHGVQDAREPASWNRCPSAPLIGAQPQTICSLEWCHKQAPRVWLSLFTFF